MEREPQGGSDYGSDLRREFGDEPAPAFRDAAPDLLAPIDESAPVSGHVPPPGVIYETLHAGTMTAALLPGTARDRIRRSVPQADDE